MSRPIGYTSQRELVNDLRRRDRAREGQAPADSGPFVAELSGLYQALQAQACVQVAAGEPAAVEHWFTAHCDRLAEERRRATPRRSRAELDAARAQHLADQATETWAPR